MSSTVRVGVLQIFGDHASDWRLAIQAAAGAQNWDYHEYWGGDAPAFDPQRNAIVVCADAADLPYDVSDWLVVTTAPDDAVMALIGHGLDRAQAAHHASRRFAKAADLIEDGAAVGDAYDSFIDVPHIGRVALPSPTGPYPGDRAAGEIGFYAVLPLPVGVKFPIAHSQLEFPIYRETDDGTPRVNLLGRRRTIFRGPTFVVPRGVWRLDAGFAIDCSASVHLLLGWGNDTSLEKFEDVLPHSGLYEIALTNQWSEAGTADFTGMLMTPVLEGWFELSQCSMTYLGATASTE